MANENVKRGSTSFVAEEMQSETRWCDSHMTLTRTARTPARPRHTAAEPLKPASVVRENGSWAVSYKVKHRFPIQPGETQTVAMGTKGPPTNAQSSVLHGQQKPEASAAAGGRTDR